MTQATIDLNLKEKTLQKHRATKLRLDEDNYNLQEKNKQLILDHMNMTEKNHNLMEKLNKSEDAYEKMVDKSYELTQILYKLKGEITDLKKSRELSINYSVKKELSYLETLHQVETMKKALLENKKILKNENNKTEKLQRKIRTLYNENTNYRLKLKGQGINMIKKNNKRLFDKILLTTRNIRRKITAPPSNNQELLDKVLINTRLIRREMTTPPKMYKANDCESIDSILTSTLCMREEIMMINYQNNKTCRKPKAISIINQDKRMSTGTVLLGGLAMILLLIAKPTRASSYPYTEVTSAYRPYMIPSNIAIESMQQIITQTNNLVKLDDAYQLNRMAVLNKELPDITMISDITKDHLKKIDEGATKLPQTVLNYVAAISFIIERQREITRKLKNEIRNHAIEIIMSFQQMMINGEPSERNKRETNDMDALLNTWIELNEGNDHLEIPETQQWGSLDDQTRDSLAGKWDKSKISSKDINTWIQESMDMVHEPNKKLSNTDKKITHNKNNNAKSPILNAITEKTTAVSSDLSTTETVKLTLKSVKEDDVISLPGGDILYLIDRTITHAIFKKDIMEAYFVFNHDNILIGKGVNTEATWVTQKHRGNEYIWVKYKTLTGKMGSKKLTDSEISGAEDLEVQNDEQDKMVYISNMMYYTKKFSESFNTSEEMYAFFRMVELETNQGFKNSDANITLKIHCMEMIETRDYETLTAGKALYKFQQDAPKNQADTTTLFTAGFNYKLGRRCGVAFVDVATRCKQTYSVITKDCAFRSQGFAHELGHILGVRHNSEKQAVSSANGYRIKVEQPDKIKGLKTIMSYPGRGRWMSINYWSNPNIMVHYRDEDYKIGDNTSANAVTALRKNKIYLSQCGNEDRLTCKYPMVNCGNHIVATCEMCTLGLEGRSNFCNGECTWNGKYCSLKTVKCGSHVSPRCDQCMDNDVIGKNVMETLKCHAINFIAEDLRDNERKYEGFACNSKDKHKFRGHHILLHVFNITCIDTTLLLDCPKSAEKSYIRKTFQFGKFRYHELTYVLNKVLKAFHENSEGSTTITYEDVNIKHRKFSFEEDHSFFLDHFYLNKHGTRDVSEYEELGRKMKEFLGKFWCSSKDCEFKNNKCIDNNIINKVSLPPTTTQVSPILDTIYGKPLWKSDLTYTLCYDYGILIYNINKNLEELNPIYKDINSKLSEKLFDPDDINDREIEQLEKISSSIDELLKGPLSTALTNTTMSMMKAEKTLRHLDTGIDILGIMTAEITLQIPKLLDKTTKFVRDAMHQELQKRKQDKRRKRSINQKYPNYRKLNDNINNNEQPLLNTEIPYEEYLDNMWNELNEASTLNELSEGSTSHDEFMESMRKELSKLNINPNGDEQKTSTEQQFEGSGYTDDQQTIGTMPPNLPKSEITLRDRYQLQTPQNGENSQLQTPLYSPPNLSTRADPNISKITKSAKSTARIKTLAEKTTQSLLPDKPSNEFPVGKSQDQGFQRKFVEALNEVVHEDVTLSSKFDLIGTQIPSSGPEAAIMLLSKAIGIPSDTALNSFEATKDIYDKTRQTLLNNNDVTEEDLNIFQNSLVEKLSKINNDSNTKTFTIQEGESISIKCFTDTEIENKNNIVWKRYDDKPLYNLKNTVKGNVLTLTDSKCAERGEYQCGFRSLNDQKWTAKDIGKIWHKIIINIICSNRTSIQVIPNTVIAVETQQVDLSCPTLSN
ncbi:MAG TPA: hypothetical protein DDE71_03775 [Tenacibaculum sp.]|nr:hypothetical protein [Tenacibaculum sp.]